MDNEGQVPIQYNAVFSLVPHGATVDASEGIPFVFPQHLTRYAVSVCFSLIPNDSLKLYVPLFGNESPEKHTVSKIDPETGRFIIPRGWLESSVAREDMRRRRFRVEVRGEPIPPGAGDAQKIAQRRHQQADAKNRLLAKMKEELATLDTNWLRLERSIKAPEKGPDALSTAQIASDLLPPDPFVGIKIVDDKATLAAAAAAALSRAPSKQPSKDAAAASTLSSSMSKAVSSTAETAASSRRARESPAAIPVPQNGQEYDPRTMFRSNPRLAIAQDAAAASGSAPSSSSTTTTTTTTTNATTPPAPPALALPGKKTAAAGNLDEKSMFQNRSAPTSVATDGATGGFKGVTPAPPSAASSAAPPSFANPSKTASIARSGGPSAPAPSATTSFLTKQPVSPTPTSSSSSSSKQPSSSSTSTSSSSMLPPIQRHPSSAGAGGRRSPSAEKRDKEFAAMLAEREAKQRLEADIALATRLAAGGGMGMGGFGGGGGAGGGGRPRSPTMSGGDSMFRARPGESDADFARRLAGL